MAESIDVNADRVNVLACKPSLSYTRIVWSLPTI